LLGCAHARPDETECLIEESEGALQVEPPQIAAPQQVQLQSVASGWLNTVIVVRVDGGTGGHHVVAAGKADTMASVLLETVSSITAELGGAGLRDAVLTDERQQAVLPLDGTRGWEPASVAVTESEWTIFMAAKKPGTERDAFWKPYGPRPSTPPRPGRSPP
jgi:hypothetical protein